MTPSKKLRLASIFTYLAHFLIVLALSLVCFISGIAVEAEGWEALGASILIVLALLGFIYAAVLLLPLFFSVFAYRRDFRGLIIACLLFDSLYTLFTLIYTLNFVFSGDITALIFAAFLALSLTPLILNCLILKNKTAPQQAAATTEGEQL